MTAETVDNGMLDDRKPGGKSLVALAVLAVGVCILSFSGGLLDLVERWSNQEEYSHGFLIPAISAWILWQTRTRVAASVKQPNMLGFAVLLLSAIMLVIGELSAIMLFIQLGFLVSLLGLTLVIGGWSLLKACLFPIFLLGFAIPMPYFLDSILSWRLQLISSELGVWFIRLFNVPVYLEGNVIDLGAYKLQVVDACSGLRYLYPLLSLSVLAAYFFQTSIWLRAFVVVSAVPITIVMNSFRIGVIGVAVDQWGVEMAEGALHFFEGWVIFMACAAMLMLEIWLIARILLRKPFWNVVGVEPDAPAEAPQSRTLPQSRVMLLCSIVLLAATGSSAYALSSRTEPTLERSRFVFFPNQLGEWTSQTSFLEPRIEHKLGLDDYIVADFRSTDARPINLYIAYYASQRKGFAPHSPRVCIPGGGWVITEFSRPNFSDRQTGLEFPLNRVIIARGQTKLLVYYWFEQRGRRIANEYENKWYLFRDALTQNRTDGSLVRLTTVITRDEDIADAEKRLQRFIRELEPKLKEYLPV